MTIVEKDWITAAGLRAVVLMGHMGHRCGYVGVPCTHPLHGVDYGASSDALQFPGDEPIGKRSLVSLFCNPDKEARLDCVFDVHGGLTYSHGSDDYPTPSDGLWWFGFDCGHAGDAPSEQYLAERRQRYPDFGSLESLYEDGIHRSLAYCEAECESLATQLIQRVAGAAQMAGA